MKPAEPDTDEEDYTEVDETDLPHTNKLNIEEVASELPNVITSSFNYNKYSQDDMSNDRFLEKQKKQSSLTGTLFEQIADGRQEQSYMQRPVDDMMFEFIEEK